MPVYASIYEIASNGRPACWTWGSKEVNVTVNSKVLSYALGRAELHSENPDVQNVLGVIEYCLTQKSAYARDRDATEENIFNKGVKVSLHGCQTYPVIDIFSALGWLVSVTDKPALKPSNDEQLEVPQMCFQSLLLYSRLVFNIAKDLQVKPPKTTHILFMLRFEVPTLQMGIIDLLSEDISREFEVSTSSSLPRRRKKKGQLKELAVEERRDALKSVRPGFDVALFNEKHLFHIGDCAEYLNILSFLGTANVTLDNPRRMNHAWGLALDVEGVDVDFDSMENMRKRGITKAACDACCHLLETVGITYYDLSNGRAVGEIPPRYEMDANWIQTTSCSICYKDVPVEACIECGVCNKKYCNVKSESIPDWSYCKKEGLKHDCEGPIDYSLPKDRPTSDSESSSQIVHTAPARVPPRDYPLEGQQLQNYPELQKGWP